MYKFQRFQDLDELFPPAHAEPSVESFFRSAPVRGSMVNLLIYLADQLTKGFQTVDNQFQALETQVTEDFQSMDTRLQELEAEVAQIQLNVWVPLCRVWYLKDFFSSLYQLFYKLLIILGYLQTLLFYPYYFWILELFV
jgi:hypothetical protein